MLEIKNDTSRVTVKETDSGYRIEVFGEGLFSGHEIRTIHDFTEAAKTLRASLSESQEQGGAD